jgi:hypothetical protein
LPELWSARAVVCRLPGESLCDARVALLVGEAGVGFTEP